MSLLSRKYLELIRFDKPTGTVLLYLPCVLALLLATDSLPKISDLLFYFAGAFLMRSAGCIINDLWDVEYDKQVARTKNRPLASAVISKKEALIFLFFLLMLATFLLFFLNKLAIIIALLSIPLIVAYPLMKRITYYPQVFLGITFNLSILIVWADLNGKLSFPAYLLYLAGIFYTLAYDTIYGYQDISDDIKIGVKSTSIKFGNDSRKIIIFFYFLFLIILLFLGLNAGFGIFYLIVFNLLAFVILHNIQNLDLTNPEACLQEFKRAPHYLFYICIIIFSAKLLAFLF